jgi:hypothetical protein
MVAGGPRTMRSDVVALFVAALAGKSNGGGGGGNDAAGDVSGANCLANPADLISDFESDNSLAAVGGRQGGWYTYGDDLGMFDRPNGYNIEEGNPNCTSAGSLHIKGTGFSMWGAATGVDWKPRPSDGDGGYGDKMLYDASAYRGIAFWAKSSETLDGVQVGFPDLYTDGGAPAHDMPHPTDSSAPPVCTDCRCIYNALSEYNCSPYLVQFGLKGDAAADLVFAGYSSYRIEPTWKRFEVLFVDTRQDPGNLGYKPPGDRLSADKLTAMAIQINADYSTGSARARNFEIWLDDVAFIR